MSYPDIATLFSPYIHDAALLAPFASATVTDMQVNRAERFLRMTLRLDHFVPYEAFSPVEEALAQGLGLRTVELLPLYPEDSLREACFPTIVSFLRRRCVAVNGTFNDAVYTREGEGFAVTLCHGGMDMVRATHTDTMMGQLIGELFGRRVPLTFRGEAGVNEKDEQYRKLME